jgi:homoserine kinase type II
MAVYTDLTDEDLTRFVAEYDLGSVLSCKGIAEGVENSNFLLQTDFGSFILTIYEKRVNPDDLPFFIGLMEHLAAQGFSCPTPVGGRDGKSLRKLCGKPAAIITFLEGLWPRSIMPVHCVEVGRTLAEFHAAGHGFDKRRPNDLSVAGWQTLIDEVGARADEVAPGLATLLQDEIGFLAKAWPKELPSGTIHADMFPDNVFFRGETCSGVIDFYFACTDFLAYDLGICINAWCFDAEHRFQAGRARDMIAAYQTVRPLSATEKAALPLLARGSALRFLLTRLYDWLNQQPGALVRPKDPLEYLARLRFHAAHPDPAVYGL